MDVVYPVRPGASHEELRFSLRSIAANLAHDRVWLVGYRPAWVAGVEHVAAPTLDRWSTVPSHLRAITALPELGEEFIYLNDDFFVLRPAAGAPVWHRGPIAAEVAAHPAGTWRRGQAETLELLRCWGIREPLSYELHVPMVMTTTILAEALARAATAGPFAALAYRSLYGNVAGVGGEPTQDVKIFGRTARIPIGATFLSTNDDSFANGRVGRQLRARFPEACRYEA
jgi:hypothetical protein